VIGRIQDNRLLLDLRTLDDPSTMVSRMELLKLGNIGR